MCLPAAFVFVSLSSQWIKSRTGIRSRRVLQQGESLKDLAVAAAAEALAAAERVSPSPPGRAPFDIVVCATSSPDDLFGDGPAVAAQVLEAFFGKDAPRAKGISAGPPAFGLTAACSGFVAGLISGEETPRSSEECRLCARDDSSAVSAERVE